MNSLRPARKTIRNGKLKQISDEKIPRLKTTSNKSKPFSSESIKNQSHFHTIVQCNEMKLRRRENEADQRE